MGWRKFENHQQETKAVKAALKKQGINATVKHGKGTAWSWLEINIGSLQQWGEHLADTPSLCPTNCPRCEVYRALTRYALSLAKQTTGREGDYGGNILVLTQDRWDDNAGRIPIVHNRAKVDKFLAMASV